MTDDDRALLLWLLMQKRSRMRTLADMKRRDRRIAMLVDVGGPMFPKLINVVRWELESLALGTDKAAEVGRLVNNYARSWAYAMLHETEDALAAVRPHNLKWATEDALVKASGKVIKLVAAQTGSLVKWITERDERVCSVCEPRDGVVYQADQAPDLPAHPRCRCGLVAVANRMAEAA